MGDIGGRHRHCRLRGLAAVCLEFRHDLFLIFAGMLLGVGLNAMTKLLGSVVNLPHSLRLTIVCLMLAGLLSGVVFLGGATIAQQATVLSDTIKSQLVGVKAFLERNGIDTSYFDLGNGATSPSPSSTPATPATPSPPAAHNLPSAGTIASSGGAIISQTLKLLLGTVSAVGNFFIVLFLGLTFAAQPGVYRKGLLFLAPARHRFSATIIVDRIGETLERWLIAQILTMFAVFMVTWNRPCNHRHPEFVHSRDPGRPARLYSHGWRDPRRLDRGAREPGVGLGRRRQRLRIVPRRARHGKLRSHPDHPASGAQHPPATLFAFQILLGVVFGIWGLALALPLMAIVKVMIDHFKADDGAADPGGGLSPRAFAGQAAEVTTVLVCSTSGGEAKYCPTRPRHSVKFSELRKSTVWFSRVSHLTIRR